MSAKAIAAVAPTDDPRLTDFDAAHQAARDADPMFYQKLAEAKKRTPIAR